MNKYNINNLLNNILEIVDNNTNEIIHYKKISFSKIIGKYSSAKIPVYRIIIDDNIINRRNNYNVKYTCILCNIICDTAINTLNRKINKNIVCCRTCKEKNPDKRKQQSLMMKANKIQTKDYVKKNHIKKVTKSNEIVKKSKLLFENMDYAFKCNYFNRHLTKSEFDILKHKIISVHNKKYAELNSFEYVPYIICNNQSKFIPMLWDKSTDRLHNIQYIEYKCDK